MWNAENPKRMNVQHAKSVKDVSRKEQRDWYAKCAANHATKLVNVQGAVETN